MSEFWKTKQFKDLKDIWEKKLESSGFLDAEKDIGDERHLKQTSIATYRNNSSYENEKDEKEDYFRILSQKFSEEQDFYDELDKKIMEMTVNGSSIREISDALRLDLKKDQRRSKFNRVTIRFVRRRYENKWGMKVWKPTDMVSRKVKKAPTR